MSNLQINDVSIDAVKELVLEGSIAKLSNDQKVKYMVGLCQSLGLNPASKPFQVIKFQGKEILYATKDATEQLRKVHGVSVTSLNKTTVNDVFIVEAVVTDAQGRTDVGTGAVPIGNLKGEALANAIMKGETKAKRRATLSICGLGFLDESELDTMKGAEHVDIEPAKVTGQLEMATEQVKEAFHGEEVKPQGIDALPDDIKQVFRAMKFKRTEVKEYCEALGYDHDAIRKQLVEDQKLAAVHG